MANIAHTHKVDRIGVGDVRGRDTQWRGVGLGMTNTNTTTQGPRSCVSCMEGAHTQHMSAGQSRGCWKGMEIRNYQD